MASTSQNCSSKRAAPKILSLMMPVLDKNTRNLRTFLSIIQSSIAVLRSLRPLVLLIIAVKVKENFTLEQATKAQRGSRGITLLFL